MMMIIIIIIITVALLHSFFWVSKTRLQIFCRASQKTNWQQSNKLLNYLTLRSQSLGDIKYVQLKASTKQDPECHVLSHASDTCAWVWQEWNSVNKIYSETIVKAIVWRLSAYICVCVCVCARARARACVCDFKIRIKQNRHYSFTLPAPLLCSWGLHSMAQCHTAYAGRCEPTFRDSLSDLLGPWRSDVK